MPQRIQTAPIVPGRATVQFAADTCRACPLRDAYTTASGHRSIALRPKEACSRNCAHGCERPTGEPTSVTARPWTTRWRGSIEARGRKPATRARARTLDLRPCATVVNLQSLAHASNRLVSLRVQFFSGFSSTSRVGADPERAKRLTSFSRAIHLPATSAAARHRLRNDQSLPCRSLLPKKSRPC
jgi:hypothetical protein